MRQSDPKGLVMVANQRDAWFYNTFMQLLLLRAMLQKTFSLFFLTQKVVEWHKPETTVAAEF